MKSEDYEEGRHNRAETDTREIDMPKTCCQKKDERSAMLFFYFFIDFGRSVIN